MGSLFSKPSQIPNPADPHAVGNKRPRPPPHLHPHPHPHPPKRHRRRPSPHPAMPPSNTTSVAAPPAIPATTQPNRQSNDKKPTHHATRNTRSPTRRDSPDADADADREEDIRGTYIPDAPVRTKFILRAVRDPETGALSLDTKGTPLYSPSFFDDCHARANVVPPAQPSLANDAEASARASHQTPRTAARLHGREDQKNFLGRDLQKLLRKRALPFARSKQAFSAWNDDDFETGRLTGAFGERDRARTIDLRDKTYLAPLTTVGNLPFRRVCKRLGADVTCGEMAMAPNLLQGQNSEWALLRRHREEDLFGVQLAGSNVETLTRAAELVSQHCELDFVEINCGCPIDIVFNRGGGCALMKRRTKLSRMVWSVAQAAQLPVGVKVRTGVSQKDRNAHEVIADIAQAGASWVTVHGRSRKQRYSKVADWGYIVDQCAPAARRAGVTLLGNGDVYNWRDATRYFSGGECADKGVGAVMVARGALIKPWLFTEIKERRDWDIRSSERLDIYREFAKFGLEHWGADERGVANTRKFLLEWLSFLYRYVPIGLLETGTESVVTMGHRAPFFRGRDELETLLGSPQGKDWVRITELLLGKAPPGFSFTPKHKSNAWDGGGDGGDDAQG